MSRDAPLQNYTQRFEDATFCLECYNMATEPFPKVFSIFYWADCQLLSAPRSTFHRICVLTVFCDVDIREDAKNHMTDQRNFH